MPPVYSFITNPCFSMDTLNISIRSQSPTGRIMEFQRSWTLVHSPFCGGNPQLLLRKMAPVLWINWLSGHSLINSTQKQKSRVQTATSVPELYPHCQKHCVCTPPFILALGCLKKPVWWSQPVQPPRLTFHVCVHWLLCGVCPPTGHLQSLGSAPLHLMVCFSPCEELSSPVSQACAISSSASLRR